MPQMKVNETQTAAMFSVDIQSRFDVSFMIAPYLNGEASYQARWSLKRAVAGAGTDGRMVNKPLIPCPAWKEALQTSCKNFLSVGRPNQKFPQR
jgi:hypothetical protein